MRYPDRAVGRLTVIATALIAILLVSPVFAAEVAGGEIYRLEAGEVVADDLYVSANEVYIAGTVEGDLYAAGSFVTVSGTVTGDANLAGAGVNVSGTVEDDLRVAGAGIDLSGTVGDDLLAAAGGSDFAAPIIIGNRSVAQGLRLLDSAQVGGEALLTGGQGVIGGTIGEDLRAAMASLTLGAQVGGDARLNGNTIMIHEPAQVDGVLRYSTGEELSLSPEVADDIVYVAPPEEPVPDPAQQTIGWLIRTGLVLLGFALLGWLLLSLWPATLARPANAIAARPGRASLYGVLAMISLMIIPLVSALLVFLMVLFWGWLPGIVLGMAIFGVLAVLWFLSPLITGAWLGQWLSRNSERARGSRLAVLGGILLLALLTRIPIVGWFVAAASFIFALGGLILARRAPAHEAPAARQ